MKPWFAALLYIGALNACAMSSEPTEPSTSRPGKSDSADEASFDEVEPEVAGDPVSASAGIPEGATPVLRVTGPSANVQFPLYEGNNFIGRSDEDPVDIDLEDLEPPDRIFASRQHALVVYDPLADEVILEDLNSSNGTFLNRDRVQPGFPKPMRVGDVIQIGTLHLTLAFTW